MFADFKIGDTSEEGKSMVIVHCGGIYFCSSHYLPDHIRPRCRLLHGHTFLVDAVVTGEPSKRNGAVVFYSDLRNILEQIVDPMDHKVIIPRDYLSEAGNNVEFILNTNNGQEACLLPKSTVYILDRPVATIEHIAEYISLELWMYLSNHYEGIKKLELTISETPTYSATAVMESSNE